MAAGFDGFQVGQSHRGEIGYWLAKPFWGRGIMTGVVRRVCRHAFEEFGLVKVSAHVFTNNPASARVLEKCGFVEEGLLRKHFLKDGRFLDAWVFALLRPVGERRQDGLLSTSRSCKPVKRSSFGLVVTPCRARSSPGSSGRPPATKDRSAGAAQLVLPATFSAFAKSTPAPSLDGDAPGGQSNRSPFPVGFFAGVFLGHVGRQPSPP